MSSFYSNSSPFNDIGQFFRRNNALSRLILINAAVWLLIKMVIVLLFLFNKPDPAIAEGWFLKVFAIPAFLPSLLLRPWSILTYMFLHFDFFHILFNMLWLYWFGIIFLQYLTSRQMMMVYLLGGISGGFLYILAFNIFPVFAGALPDSLALGASASVMAIVTSISFYVPNYSVQFLFIGRVKILYLAIVLFVIDFFSISTGNSGGHIAHIGGAFFGYFYVMMLRNGYFQSLGRTVRFSEQMMSFFSSKNRTKKSTSGQYQRPVTDEDYNLNKKLNQQRTDEILEKIKKGGYESLSKAEKEFLFKASGKE